jgi:hypothetical protein
VASTDHARNQAIRALDAFSGQESMQTADYQVGYLANALEDMIYALRAGA